MSFLFTLMSDNVIKKIQLSEEIEHVVSAEIQDRFIKAAYDIMHDGIEEDPFNGDVLARCKENIMYVDYQLPEMFKNIPDNTADLPVFSIGEEIPKSIFWYDQDNDRFLFQIFNRRSLLDKKFILKKCGQNKFSKMSEDAFIVEDRIQAIYKDGKLFFINYSNANQIFSLLDFVTEATDGDIDEFVENNEIDISADVLKSSGNVKTRRLIKSISQTDNVKTFMGKASSTKLRLLKKYNVPARIEHNQLVFPTKSVGEINRVLEFLNEDMFIGAISSSHYRVNSKKRDQ